MGSLRWFGCVRLGLGNGVELVRARNVTVEQSGSAAVSTCKEG